MALFLNGKQVRGSLIVEGDLTMPLPTIDTASGSVATFDTDMTENLVECVIDVSSGSDSVSIFVNSINLWNEQWEVGAYNINTGEKSVNINTLRNKHKIKVSGNTTYFFRSGNTGSQSQVVAIFYDCYGNFLTNISGGNNYMTVNNIAFTTPLQACYMAFYIANTTTYNNDISINYPSTDTQYHAFNGYYITFGETMSGDGSFDVLSGMLTRSDDTTKQLDANYIQTTNGINNIWGNTGDTRVKFLLTVGKKIA